MSMGWADVIFVGSLIAALALTYRPLGDYMARVYTDPGHLRVERGIYRVLGINPEVDQTWGAYTRAMLGFSFMSVMVLYALLRLQNQLPFSNGFPAVPPQLAWNTAASFTTNTNWQNYSGESTLGYTAQAAGLTVQNFVSAAVGIVVAIALVRGFARHRTNQLGNFWVDLVRTVVRILLPMSLLLAIVLVAGGALQNWHPSQAIHTLAGGTQTLPGGPVASQEAIKQIGTNGGGFFNANASHPWENPTAWTDWLLIYFMVAISFSLPRTFGKMINDKRQGLAIVAAMAIIAVISLVAITTFQMQHHGTVPVAVGSSMEGMETRFGIPNSAAFANATTLTSTGAINSAHDSYTSLSGGVLLLNMMYGEVAPGGTGSGLYGMLILAVITVFIAGLMVGRTPDYLRKKISAREVKFGSLYILGTPLVALTFTAIAMALPGERASMLNNGAHGLSEVLYGFTSMANNNGSAFAGLNGNTAWFNIAGGIAMLLARFVPMIFILGLAGSLAKQGEVPISEGTLPTHKWLFILMLTGVTIIVVALTYFPALALGPLAEGLH